LARAPDAQAELDHLTGDASGSNGEASGFDGRHWAFPKKTSRDFEFHN